MVTHGWGSSGQHSMGSHRQAAHFPAVPCVWPSVLLVIASSAVLLIASIQHVAAITCTMCDVAASVCPCPCPCPCPCLSHALQPPMASWLHCMWAATLLATPTTPTHSPSASTSHGSGLRCTQQVRQGVCTTGKSLCGRGVVRVYNKCVVQGKSALA
jgi:hypothetical protein